LLIPRAYIETIFSSKAGKRRWYLAMSSGVEARLPVAGDGEFELAAVRRHRLSAVAVAAVPGAVLAGKMMIHLGIQRPLGERCPATFGTDPLAT
jgi:hypothetical protein